MRCPPRKYGEFPLVVVREHYRSQGYTVWASEPELDAPDFKGFILVSYPGKRRDGHEAYKRMQVALTQGSCDRIATMLNRRPRKRLNYQTPQECFNAR